MFATEDDNEKLDKDFQPPKDLSQLSFASGDKVQSQGLMSLKELDESHKRKEQLLSAAPLGGSLWDEAETSKAGSARSAKAVNASSTKASASNSKDATTTYYGKEPKYLRQASYQSTGSIKSAKRFFGGQKEKAAAIQTVPVPPRDSSTVKPLDAGDDKGLSGIGAVSGAEGGALGVTGIAPSIIAADLNRESVSAQVKNDGAPSQAQDHLETGTAASMTGMKETEKASVAGPTGDESAPSHADTEGVVPSHGTENEALSGKIETAQGVLSGTVATGDAQKHSDSIVADDLDKTLTTNDVEKLALGEEKGEVNAVSTISQEAESQSATQEEATTKAMPIAEAEAVGLTPEATS